MNYEVHNKIDELVDTDPIKLRDILISIVLHIENLGGTAYDIYSDGYHDALEDVLKIIESKL